MTKILYYIPIIHTQSDMGTLSESIEKVTLQKLGERTWRRKHNLIERFWSGIEDTIDTLSLSYAQTRVYQDGLPVCDKEIEIVTEIAKKGSTNHRLLIRLMEKGATIMGTESAELLIEEYHQIKKILESGDVKKGPGDRSQAEGGRRSSPGEAGCLHSGEDRSYPAGGRDGHPFPGDAAQRCRRLPEDIQVLYPINRPLDKRKR